MTLRLQVLPLCYPVLGSLFFRADGTKDWATPEKTAWKLRFKVRHYETAYTPVFLALACKGLCAHECLHRCRSASLLLINKHHVLLRQALHSGCCTYE